MSNELLEKEVLRINKFVDKNGYNIEYDNQGQIVIYTGIYASNDGSFDYIPEEEDNESP